MNSALLYVTIALGVAALVFTIVILVGPRVLRDRTIHPKPEEPPTRHADRSLPR